MTRSVRHAFTAAFVILLAAVGSLAATGGFAHAKEKATTSTPRQTVEAPVTRDCVALAKSVPAMAEFFVGDYQRLELGQEHALQFFAKVREAVPEMLDPPGEIANVTFAHALGSDHVLALFAIEGSDECAFATISAETLGQWAVEVIGRQV